MVDQLEEIKSKIDIVSFISEYLPLKKAGRNFRALCPFHTEKSPSFVVSPERQIFHCFGCNSGGDIFGFLMKIENLEFPEALEILAKRAGIKLVRNFQTSEQAKLKEKIYAINHLASEFFHWLLLNHPSGKEALNYVLGRGVKKPSLDTFKIGWAPNSWDSLMRFLLKKGYTTAELETAGLIIRSVQPATQNSTRFYDRFRGRLMFTLCDQRGNVLGFAGRTLDPNVKEAKYINSPETPVYVKGNVLYGLDVTKEAVKKEDRAIIVEGELDLISSFQAGTANVVAIKGSALTEGQVNLLKRFTQNIFLALDMDLAGDAAAKRGIETADAAGFSIKVVRLPIGKDPDECARTNPGLYQKAIKNAIPVFDYVLASAVERFGKDSAESKKKIGDEVLPVLAKITNPIIQAHYLSQLANLLSVSEEVIVEALRRAGKKAELGSRQLTPVLPQNQVFSRQEILEEQLLSMILQSDNPQETLINIKSESADEFLTATVVKKIFNLLEKYFETSKQFKIDEFVKTLPPELVAIVDRLYLSDLHNFQDEKKVLLGELGKTIKEVKKVFLKNRLFALAQKLKEATTEETDILNKEYRARALELKNLK